MRAWGDAAAVSLFITISRSVMISACRVTWLDSWFAIAGETIVESKTAVKLLRGQQDFEDLHESVVPGPRLIGFVLKSGFT